MFLLALNLTRTGMDHLKRVPFTSINQSLTLSRVRRDRAKKLTMAKFKL